MTTLVLGMVLPWLLIFVGAWLGYQLTLQNGRMLLRLESIEKLLSPRAGAPRKKAGGVPIGTAAPDFELLDLTGARRKLSDFLGTELLLIFFNPKCGFCTSMAAELAALPVDESDGRAIPVVVSSGDAEENRKLVEQYGIRCLVLLQENMEVASRYGAQGTPMGYRIDRAGRVASELTVGAQLLLQLAAPIAALKNGSAASAIGSSKQANKPDPSLARSRLQRGGLKAGAAAPDFRLPRIDGGELSLTDFKGRRVLLIFSDPDCGPCDQLAPQLQQLHLERPDLQIVVVSRRDAEANREKSALQGLTFPIVLQRQWEVSLKYAMFATPIGYLIDEQGIIVRDVAVGVEPILSLAKERPRSLDAESLLAEKEPALAN
jgi:peroxiredoxin